MTNLETLFLYGPSGAGKTSAGRRVAESLEMPFVDLDEEIEKTAGTSVAEIFEREGERMFRELEAQMLRKVLFSSSNGVIALGGGALLNSDNRAIVEARGRVVCLSASPSVLLKRLLADSTPRPLLMGNPEASLEDYLTTRMEHYSSFPLIVATDSLSPSETAWEVQKATGMFHLTAMGTPYDVRIAEGSFRQLIASLDIRGLTGVALVVGDSNTRVYADRVASALRAGGRPAASFTFPAGERSKTIQTVEQVWRAALDAGLDREGLVFAVGGGVTGDLAGFAAATFMRGVRWVVVPTSLLAMVDASLGGKTGVDLPQGKNLAGAFHAPSFVLCDPDTLQTLPERELRAGMAEVIKAAVIGDEDLFEQLGSASGLDAAPRMIAGAAAVKMRILEEDPFERGPRKALNFGHTVGHAVEQASGYQLRHGEAVAIGMAVEARMAEKLGIAAAGVSRQVVDVLRRYDLPTRLPEQLDTETVLGCMRVDKKKVHGQQVFALPLRIGGVTIVELETEEFASLIPRLMEVVR